MTHAKSIGLCSAMLLGVAACGSDPTPAPRAAAPEPAPTIAVTWRESSEPTQVTEETSAIIVEREIARRCNLPTAYFAFDSARVTDSAESALAALAQCFTEGALRGRSMKIVGHADPRGTQEYNLALGQRRAGSVAEYLADKGIDERKIETTSMGELEARGEDEQGWARDRKVEILLGDEAIVVEER